MSIQQKLVSIIIPLYNAESYLRDTLDSVLSQTYSNWECIIVDDGSIDLSKDIALDYAKKDDRFKYYLQKNSGPSAARNKGLELSYGDYIQFLDADDVILPERIAILLEKSNNTSDNVIFYSNVLLGNSENIYDTSTFRQPTHIGNDVTFDEMYRRFGLDFLFIPSCLFIPKNVIGNDNWDESLSHSEDWDFYLRLLKKNYIFRYIGNPLVIYRNTPNSLSKNYINTITANYRILETWVAGKNWIFFSIRCAFLVKRNIMLCLTKKADKIVIPCLSFHKPKKVTIKFFFSLLIIPITVFYLIFEFSKIVLKRLGRSK